MEYPVEILCLSRDNLQVIVTFSLCSLFVASIKVKSGNAAARLYKYAMHDSQPRLV